jgi:hypothetical protein
MVVFHEVLPLIFNSTQFNSIYFALTWSIGVTTHQIWKLSIQNIRLKIYIHTYIHTNNIHDVWYNTVNFSLYLDRQHCDCIMTVGSYISYGVQYIIFKIVYEYNEATIQYSTCIFCFTILAASPVHHILHPFPLVIRVFLLINIRNHNAEQNYGTWT